MTSVQRIRKVIELAGGLNKFSSHDKKTRPVGCPMKKMMKDDLQDLSNAEIHIAFRMGLIGNSNKKGTIVANSKK